MLLDPDACYRALASRDPRFDGRFFTGVRTTGVFCRPICPARTPRREHVLFLPNAAAALAAGFRPCLRCRPELSPGMASWRGTASTVSRALALIEAGALDASDTNALADRLGVGARQLRRLFQRHLGASPLAVAQARRLLLAARLVRDTELPLGDVALAAGFRSVRRFNEAFRATYDRAPGALRRRGRRGGDAASPIALSLACRAPFDWAGMLAFLRARAIPGVEVVTDASYRRVIAAGDALGTLSAELAPGAGAVRVVLRLPALRVLGDLIARTRRLFDLDADPHAIGAQLAADARLAPLVTARPGLRVPGAWDAFELAVRAVLGQQVSVAAATCLAGRLVAAYGEPLPDAVAEPGLSHAFPRPARLARTDLAPLGLPRARAATISTLAAAVAADATLLEPGRSLEEAVARLRALPGIGDWTAHYVAMRALSEPDAFPCGDLGLQRALGARDGRRPRPGELRARAEPWRPWRAYAALYLWHGEPAPEVRSASV